MKRDGFFLVALVAIGAGLYFLMKGRTPARLPATATTGTSSTAPLSFWDQILARGVNYGGGQLSRATGGAVGGAGSGTDISPLIKAGATTLTTWLNGLARKVFRNDSPGTSPGYGTEDYGPRSTWEDYDRVRASNPEFSEGGGFSGPDWREPDTVDYLGDFNMSRTDPVYSGDNGAPIDDSYDENSSGSYDF